MKKKGKIHIGTSGWHYSHWKGPFYPEDLPEKRFLSYYIEYFSTVEINRTFYSLPKKKVFEGYVDLVPRSFLFSVKASRFITHIKRLKDPKASINRLVNVVSGLGNHLGPILFLLPPGWKLNLERLKSFLKLLPKGYRYVFELRDRSWLNEEVYALLKKYRAAFCIYQLDFFLTPKIITSNFIYVRLHGPKEAYRGKYPLKTLKEWANFFQKEAKGGKDVYCYFDNDERGYAALNALELSNLLKK